MCHPSPGPRCWKDTSERQSKLVARLDKAQAERDSIAQEMSDAGLTNDYTKYEKARGRFSVAEEKGFRKC